MILIIMEKRISTQTCLDVKRYFFPKYLPNSESIIKLFKSEMVLEAFGGIFRFEWLDNWTWCWDWTAMRTNLVMGKKQTKKPHFCQFSDKKYCMFGAQRRKLTQLGHQQHNEQELSRKSMAKCLTNNQSCKSLVKVQKSACGNVMTLSKAVLRRRVGQSSSTMMWVVWKTPLTKGWLKVLYLRKFNRASNSFSHSKGRLRWNVLLKLHINKLVKSYSVWWVCLKISYLTFFHIVIRHYAKNWFDFYDVLKQGCPKCGLGAVCGPWTEFVWPPKAVWKLQKSDPSELTFYF